MSLCDLQVVIDAFRLINPNMMVLGQEPRQTTSNLGHLQKPSIQVSHDVVGSVDQLNDPLLVQNCVNVNCLPCSGVFCSIGLMASTVFHFVSSCVLYAGLLFPQRLVDFAKHKTYAVVTVPNG